MCRTCKFYLTWAVLRLQPSKRYRSNHIHDCRRRQRAKELGQLPSCLEYCFDCLEWYIKGTEWDRHCQGHLPISTKICGSITYCHTLIKPAFCPDCLQADIPVALRMRSWDRDADALLHMQREHLDMVTWPSVRPCCSMEWEDERSFYYHLSDVHGLRSNKNPTKRKAEDQDCGNLRTRRITGKTESNCQCSGTGTLQELPALPMTQAGIVADPMLPPYTETELYPNFPISSEAVQMPEFWNETSCISSRCASLGSTAELPDVFELPDKELDNFACPPTLAINGTDEGLSDGSVVVTGYRSIADPSPVVTESIKKARPPRIKLVSKKQKLLFRVKKDTSGPQRRKKGQGKGLGSSTGRGYTAK